MPTTVSSSYSWKAGLVSDFTRASTLEPKVWNQGWFAKSTSAISGPVNANETAAYSPRNLSLDGQGLHLRLTNTPSGGKLHTGAGINSRKLVSLTPGCWVEARLNLPGANGRLWDWPGFWLNGYDRPGRQWPQYGEIDIMEVLELGYPAWHYHWGSNPGMDTAQEGADVPGDYTGWHVYAVHWEPDRIDFYYDGNRVGSVTQNVQSDPHYLVLGHSTSNSGRVNSQVICSSVRTWTHT